MLAAKKKTPRPGGVIDTKTLMKVNESVTTTLAALPAQFDPTMTVATSNARITVEPRTDVVGGQQVQLVGIDGAGLVLTPTEALAVAAALESIATYIVEETQAVAA